MYSGILHIFLYFENLFLINKLLVFRVLLNHYGLNLPLMFNKLIEKIAEEFTLEYGILGLVLIFLAYLVFHLTTKILTDKDKQIDNLASENKEYRERFTNLLDKQFNFKSQEKSKP